MRKRVCIQLYRKRLKKIITLKDRNWTEDVEICSNKAYQSERTRNWQMLKSLVLELKNYRARPGKGDSNANHKSKSRIVKFKSFRIQILRVLLRMNTSPYYLSRVWKVTPPGRLKQKWCAKTYKKNCQQTPSHRRNKNKNYGVDLVSWADSVYVLNNGKKNRTWLSNPIPIIRKLQVESCLQVACNPNVNIRPFWNLETRSLWLANVGTRY